jgi:predicted nucleic acid-binding protein
MTVVIDNNIIVDAFMPNVDFEKQAKDILGLAAGKKIDGFIAANSITDIFYVLRKKHGNEKTKGFLLRLTRFLDIIGVEPVDSIAALNNPMSDLEDALVDVCAKKIKADYIVSRDEKFVKAQTEVKVITPNQLLSVFG